MKLWIRKFGNGAIGVALAVTLAVFLGGCGRATNEETPASAGVRGEPIVGEPIVAGPPASITGPEASDGSVAQAEPPSGGEASDLLASSASTVQEEGREASPEATGLTEQPTPDTPAGPSREAAGTPERPMAVSFEKLASFKYDVPDGPIETNGVQTVQASATQIPESIKELDEKFVSLKGFMLPLKVEKGLVTELLMMRDQSMCCYGTVPRINEWVSVKMVGGGVKPIMDQAVTLYGTLQVGEMYENGYLVGIYAMDGERMAGPLDM
jgi:hypothetical protein